MNSVPPSPGSHENRGTDRALPSLRPQGRDFSGGTGRRRTLAALGVLAAGLLGGALWLGRLPALQAAPPPTVLVLGDSLSAAYQMASERGWVELLRQRIQQAGLPHQVVNASRSGDTTAGGLNRLPPLLSKHRPSLVLIELGGNDGLKQLPLAEVAGNLRAIVRMVREAGARPVVLGMQLPRNYNPRYRDEFTAVFPRVAQDQQATLVPFFLESVTAPGEMQRFFQSDGIHPNELAQPPMMDSVWRVIEPLLQGRGGTP